MALLRRDTLPILVLLWLLAFLGAVAALQSPAPLFVNLGAGDAPFARGFRSGWERDGLDQSGETMFHWTEDGARLEFPLNVRGGRLEARLRLARFAPDSAEIVAFVGDRVVDRWIQEPSGWKLRSVDLGDVRGPLSLRFRSNSVSGDALGIALDWAEVRGAQGVVPRVSLWAGLAALLLGVPLLVALMMGARSSLVAAVGLMTTAALAVRIDRLGGLVGLFDAGLPALLATGVLGLAFAGLAHFWPDSLAPDRKALRLPLVAAVLVLVALSHPFFYYPDVDTHAQFVRAIRADPSLVLDPREYQARTGAWTREIDGHRVAFPYSAGFHLIASPLARVLGDVPAVKTAAVVALGTLLILAPALARGLGLRPGAGLWAQAILLLLPVTASRLTLALYPALMGQALELFLVVWLLRSYPMLEGARSALMAAFVLLMAQAAYTGSLFNVAALVSVFVTIELVAGERRRALRLLAACVASALVVVTVLYGRFLPVLWSEVLPHAGDATAGTGGSAVSSFSSVIVRAARRFHLFYDTVYPALLVPGFLAIREAPRHARRIVASVLLAAACLLVLRYVLPALFRDVKEIELMAAPIAVLSAGGLCWLWKRRGWPSRVAALAAGLFAAVFGAASAVEAYAQRFLAIGR